MDSAQEGGTITDTIGVAGTDTATLAVGGAPNVIVLVKNTGANPITAMAVRRSPRGTLASDDDAANDALTAAGDLAAAGIRRILITDNEDKVIYLDLGSTLGTTYTVEWAAGR